MKTGSIDDFGATPLSKKPEQKNYSCEMDGIQFETNDSEKMRRFKKHMLEKWSPLLENITIDQLLEQ